MSAMLHVRIEKDYATAIIEDLENAPSFNANFVMLTQETSSISGMLHTDVPIRDAYS